MQPMNTSNKLSLIPNQKLIKSKIIFANLLI